MIATKFEPSENWLPPGFCISQDRAFPIAKWAAEMARKEAEKAKRAGEGEKGKNGEGSGGKHNENKVVKEGEKDGEDQGGSNAKNNGKKGTDKVERGKDGDSLGNVEKSAMEEGVDQLVTAAEVAKADASTHGNNDDALGKTSEIEQDEGDVAGGQVVRRSKRVAGISAEKSNDIDVDKLKDTDKSNKSTESVIETKDIVETTDSLKQSDGESATADDTLTEKTSPSGIREEKKLKKSTPIMTVSTKIDQPAIDLSKLHATLYKDTEIESLPYILQVLQPFLFIRADG